MDIYVWRIITMIVAGLVVGSFYAFAVVRRISVDGPTFDRVTHYKVIVGCFVTLALPLLFGLSDFLTWVLYFSAFAATGMPMWLEYETRPPPKRAQ